ncbi:MAG: extracellular solute-binding protein, partial [Oscillospiraceae bacterium]|nr:extracellular solute-binding protein [Oscillospiraceae bacterium]
MKKRILSFLLIYALFTQGFYVSAGAADELSREEIDDILWRYTIDDEIPTFTLYRDLYPVHRPDRKYIIDAAGFSRYLEGEKAAVPEIWTDYEGEQGESVLTSEDSVIEYEIYIEEAGLYDISLLYYPVEGKSSEIQRSFFVNGVLPYRELATIQFTRIWQNTVANEARGSGYVELVWERDNQGNELKPRMVEAPEWQRAYLRDVDGYITSRLPVYLDAGLNTITIAAQREPMLIREIMLDNPPPPMTYAEYRQKHDAAGAVAVQGATVELQAQNANRTSSQMLYPVQDTSSPALTPSSPKLLLNNTIGGNSWRFAGQWVEWNFTVPENGYYTIGVNVRQNFRRGTYTSRKISINGEVPFLEMEDYGFVYSQTWRHETLSDSTGEGFMFYLEAGTIHTIRFEVVLGQFANIISEVREAVYELNAVYRKIIRLTGIKPDKYRDYQINRSLPELKGEMVSIRNRLDRIIDEIRLVAVRGSDQDRILVAMRDQLDNLIRNTERFPRQLDTFKSNVRACGTWLNDSMLQPLQLDAIVISSPDTTHKMKNNTIFHRIWFEISRLFYSFFIDYNRIGNVSDNAGGDTITLWIGSGRDQANVIKSLIDERFTRETEINVNVMLVDMSTLLQATLARQGPDVAIQVGWDLPMNFGLRNAVADLAEFSDLPEIRKRFDPSAMVPFEFNGATYALPETQTFPMLFYRKDILSELGLGIPATWDDVKVSMAVLSQNMMEFGMLPSELLFATILFQNGGEYYNEDGSRSALDSEEGINAFRIYTEYYSDYKLDRETSVEERFRTGETPMIIADYTTYNNFQVSAPDLRGMWGFAPIPGTVQPDGSVNNVAATQGGACIIMYLSNRDASWRFLKWWTSAETQIMFGREMESLMGAAARIPTANLEAFSMLPWPVADYNALSAQFANIKGIAQVPGGYFSFRNVNNAFYSVTTPE